MARVTDSKVFRYDNPLSAFPTEMRLSGAGDLTPVRLFYDDMIPAFAKGGAVKAARKVRSEGRYGDSELIHVNPDELADLIKMWGEPTINPDTGLPEFFLGKLWKGIKKVAKFALPIAASFIPGIGPAIGGALGLSGNLGAAVGSGLLGAASGALTGGAKGALTGGVLGAGSQALFGAKSPTGAPAASDPIVAQGQQGAAQIAADTPRKVSFWNQKPLGIQNKYAVPLVGGALLLGSGKRKSSKNRDGIGPGMSVDEIVASKFQPGFKSALGGPTGFYRNLAALEDDSPIDLAEAYSYGSRPERRFFNYARGGEVRSRFAVEGPGDGRSDDIPALLSDGEYIVDAETVALLGDGSNRAGAKKLDRFRVELRKHKGRKLAAGGISAKAREPSAYLREGRA